MTRLIRSRVEASAMAAILLVGACRSPYRESVLLASSEDPGARSVVYVGLYDARDGTLDTKASRQLAEASGQASSPMPIASADVELLGGDPGLLAVDRVGRRRLAERIGARSVLIGVVRPIAVGEVREWGIVMPFPLLFGLPVFAILFPRVAVPYGMKRDVIHDAITIRLVDLESGTVEAELLTITNRSRDRSDRLEKSALAAARLMRLRGAR